MATKQKNKQYSPRVVEMATKLGISPDEVLKAVNNLLYGDGAVYRQVIDIPLHGGN